ncbi:hypothetical protein Nepgr_005003 [Nepenthes gracilis]|uniref:Uncharacterized protein n=1 Tax=Nepenthes gracilis TaxID=150966 RepID=A0AAD3XFT4_NEPGR|nr:hypothetical protein Nepgr_005003 [Nepenthes gracilis]
MYGSQFDGNAAFSGGGFMPTQAAQTADPSFSPAKNREGQGLVPFTVKQITEALSSSDEKSNFVVDGVVVNNVTVVGMVFNKVERITDVGFVLDDGTGRIDVHRWVNEAFDTKEMESIMDGMYVRVFGHLKGFQGKRQLTSFAVRPITDFNEVTYHFIECVYVHDYNHRSRRVGSLPIDGQVAVNGTPFKGYQSMPQNRYGVEGLKDIDQMVIDYLQQPSSLAREKGVHRDELARRLNISVEKIMESIKALEDEGLVYSTIDDCHYKSTANG